MMARKSKITNEEAGKKTGTVASETAGMSVAEAGRKGGRTTASRRGSAFYREIGRKGGIATSEAHGPDFYSTIGRKGGETRALDPDVRSGALGRKGAQARWGDGQQMPESPASD